MKTILETIVSTESAEGEINFAPMGIWFSAENKFAFYCFHSSATYKNLAANPSGVVNFTTDMTQFVKTALTKDSPNHRGSDKACGAIMEEAYEVIEFRIESEKDLGEKTEFNCAVLSRTVTGTRKPGFNRAQAAALEALIAVTRIGMLPMEEIDDTLKRSRIIVDKTGGQTERSAMKTIERHYESRAG